MSSVLGPAKFRKDGSKAGGIAMLIVAGGLFAFNLMGSDRGISFFAFILFCLILAFIGVFLMTHKAAIHEHGVKTENLFGKNEVSFDQIKSFSYSRVRVNGVETDRLTFTPQRGKPIHIGASAGLRQDQDLGKLVDEFSAKFARKMSGDLDRRGRVNWLPRIGGVLRRPAVAIARDGLILNDGKSDQRVPFGQVEPHINEGWLILKEQGTGKLLAQHRSEMENFYPGFRLFTSLKTPTQPTA